jgi:hypothetical protein
MGRRGSDCKWVGEGEEEVVGYKGEWGKWER